MREKNWHKVIEKAQILNIFLTLFSTDRSAPTPLHEPVCSAEAQPSRGNNVGGGLPKNWMYSSP